LPVVAGEKRPACTHGCKEACTDERQIREWFEHNPLLNIGLATEGLIVVDVDQTPDQPNPWPTNPDQRKDIEAAPSAKTPRGGRHHFFRAPEGIEVRNSISKVAPNIDIRAAGGYIVVAPSQVKGVNYEWINPLPAKRDLPLPPDWLLKLLSGEKKPAVALRTVSPRSTTEVSLLDQVRNSLPGQRNATLNKAAFSLGREVELGIRTRDAAEHALCDAALEVGLGEQEAINTIRSGLDGGVRAQQTSKNTFPCTDAGTARDSQRCTRGKSFTAGKANSGWSGTADIGNLILPKSIEGQKNAPDPF